MHKGVFPILLSTGLFWLTACSHTERIVRKMTWSTETPGSWKKPLPEGAVRFTFVQAPRFHAGLNVPGLKEHLQTANKTEVAVAFEIQCKRRNFALIRIRSVDGLQVQSDATNMWMEIEDFGLRTDSGPFPGACWY